MAKFNDKAVLQEYCTKHSYSYSALESEPQGYGKDFHLFFHHDPAKGTDGLMDETPMPVILRVDKKGDQYTITETDYTKRYLAIRG